MRIVILTAGTGSFYCGTCMRDNALAQALNRLGHETLLAPMYLPMVLDEAPATGDAPLFYGGINVYLQQVSPVFRRTPRFLDRILDSQPALNAAAKRAGMTTPDQLGELTLSMLLGEEGKQLKELQRLVEWLERDAKPDVVCLSNALLLGLAREITRRTGAAVVCTLQGEDSFLDSLPEPHRTRCWNVIHERGSEVDALIAVSRYYGDLMRECADLPSDKLHVVYNGILMDGYAPAERAPDPPAIGFLARMCPPKGLHVLVDAFIELRKRPEHQPVRLRVAGSVTAADEVYVREQKEKLTSAGLAGEADWLPNIDRAEKSAFLQSLSVLSVPATYGESFGLYVAEAWAAGVPVVQPRSGAFPELIEIGGGGLLCDSGPADLAEKLAELLSYPNRARAMGLAGRKAVEERFNVDSMAQGALEVFERALNRRRDAVGV